MSPTQPTEVDLSARCACGAVAVTARGRVRSMLLCACEDCQRSTGTGHAAVAIMSAADVLITGPTKSFALPADSGAIFTRHFCPECGTRIAGNSSRFPDAVMLPVGLFTADTAWFAPTQLIFARSHRKWDALPDSLPRHRTYRGAELR